jgi:hypothetical protein
MHLARTPPNKPSFAKSALLLHTCTQIHTHLMKTHTQIPLTHNFQKHIQKYPSHKHVHTQLSKTHKHPSHTNTHINTQTHTCVRSRGGLILHVAKHAKVLAVSSAWKPRTCLHVVCMYMYVRECVSPVKTRAWCGCKHGSFQPVCCFACPLVYPHLPILIHPHPHLHIHLHPQPYPHPHTYTHATT